MFRTEINPEPIPEKLGLKSGILTMGSCFADSIGEKLCDCKFKSLINPFGTIYHPLAIFNLLRYSLDRDIELPEWGLIRSQEVWHHYWFHSRISALETDQLVENAESARRNVSRFLENADWIFLTFGTAVGYSISSTGQLVANCHKVPQKEFSKRLFTQKELIAGFEQIYPLIENKKILLTVSPVRHLKETLELNSVSKSILRITAHTLEENFENVHYFPAYELLLDDLRDYRFYSEDLLHPSKQAVNYIWGKFLNAAVDDSSKNFVSKWGKIMKSMNHTPFHQKTEIHRKFLNDLKMKLKQFETLVDVDSEIGEINQRINDL